MSGMEGIATDLEIPPRRFFSAARRALGWSQKELARRANTAVSTIADFERGKRKLMPNNFKSVCAALGEAGIQFLVTEDRIIGVRWPESKS